MQLNFSNYKIKVRKVLQFFQVDDEYITYLKTVDDNVSDYYNETKTHIGILFEIINLLA